MWMRLVKKSGDGGGGGGDFGVGRERLELNCQKMEANLREDGESCLPDAINDKSSF